MKKQNNHYRKGIRGFGLLESLLSISILALITTVVASLLIDVNRSHFGSQESLKANRILNESTEAVRSIRDQNFLYLENGSYGLEEINGVWTLMGTEDIIDNQYTRQINVSDVYRDSSGNISSSGTTLDDRIKNVSIQIQWDSPVEGNKSVTTDLLISDWEAQETINSNVNEWENGTHTHTTTGGSGDGSLILESFLGSWETSFNDASYIFNNNANGNAIKVRNNIGYLVANYNGQVDNFSIIDVSNPQNIIVLGTLPLDDNANDVALGTNHAYVVTSNQTKEVISIDISDPYNPFITHEQDLPGTRNAISSAFLEDDILYVGSESNTDSEWYIFNVQTPDTPILINSIELGGSVREIEVENQIAYIALDGAPSLQIYDVADPLNITLLSSTSITSENNGYGIDYEGGKIYHISYKSGQAEIRIIDVSNPSSPIMMGTAEINTNGNDIEVFGTDAIITTTKIGEQFQVFDISNPNLPVLTDTVDLGATGNKLFINQEAVYVTSDDNTSALFILSRPVAQYYTNGDFLSPSFDSGSDTTEWLNFNWEGLVSPNTTISFKIRFADTEAGLNNASWVGPDGTPASSFTQPSSIITVPDSASGKRWMQYQVSMTSDGLFTPEVYNVRIQYSP